MFSSRHRGGLDQTVARAALARALDTAGLNPPDRPKLRVHDLRHTFATLLVAQGSNVVFISRQLGHASPDITLKVYAHLSTPPNTPNAPRRPSSTASPPPSIERT